MGKKARNKVLEGDYKGRGVMSGGGKPAIVVGVIKTLYLTKETVECYEVLNSSQSSTGGIVSGAIGGALLGPVGLLAGMPKAVGINLVAVKMKDGKNF